MAKEITVKPDLDALQAKIESLMADKRSIEQQIAQATAEADALIDEAAKPAGPQDSIRAIQDYLARQKQILAERGERLRMIRESGIDLKALAKSLKAPIDAAHTRRGA